MTDTLQQYCWKYLTDSSALLATAGNSGGVVRTIHLTNTDTSAITVSISLGVTNAYSDTKAVYKTFSLPPAGIHVWNGNLVLKANETLYGLASTTNKVVCVISGVDL